MMRTTLFLQSDCDDPYKFYSTMAENSPVYWDSVNNLWAIYSYENCQKILGSDAAEIPVINENNKNQLNEYALLIFKNLARAANGIEHDMARSAAELLLKNVHSIQLNEMLGKLINKGTEPLELDWVSAVCKKLAVLSVLKSFDFCENDSAYIFANIGKLVKLMLPDKSPQQVIGINEISKEIFSVTEKHLQNSSYFQPMVKFISKKYSTGIERTIHLVTSNLIGLVIQGYDGLRGLLGNSLLQALYRRDIAATKPTREYLQKLVIETLRFDPPVHNTRRTAVSDICLNQKEIKKNDLILLVLASANRDPKIFENADVFDMERTNNSNHLTFGSGSHACVANRFSVHLVAETLYHLFERYHAIRLIEAHINYEPAVNVRLPKNILISLS
jgi:cytochrome P450